MKPKTELQKKVVELSAKLPTITEKQEAWGFEHCHDKWAVHSRKTTFCLECGHEWKDESNHMHMAIIGCTCPKCGQQLKLRQPYQPAFKENAYFGILATSGGMQVVRMFFLSKKMQKQKAVYCYTTEVMQHWIDESGTVTTMSRNVMGLSHYYDQWVLDSPMEVKPPSDRESLRSGIGPYRIYPHRCILPIIKRNGFKGHFHNIATPHKLFSLLLSDSYAETLFKANQFSMLGYYSNRPQKIENTYWAAIKICIRNGYIIKDATMWTDYLQLLSHFDKDIHSARYICPENLKEAHDRLVKKKREQDRKRQIEEQRKELESQQELYAESKGMFLGLRFWEDEITIRPLQTVEEFMVEGDELKHCVFTNAYYKKTESLVLSARIDNKPIETIEVSLTDMSVVQARGMNNKSTPYHGRIVDLVQRNMTQIAKLRKHGHTQATT